MWGCNASSCVTLKAIIAAFNVPSPNQKNDVERSLVNHQTLGVPLLTSVGLLASEQCCGT